MDRTGTNGTMRRAILIAPVVEVVCRLREWRRRRAIRASLAQASDLLLRDIGLTEDDLEHALAQPLVKDASDALVKAALARERNW